MTGQLTFSADRLPLPPHELLRMLGCRGEPDPALCHAADEAIALARAVARPRAVGRLYRLVSGPSGITPAGTAVLLPGHDIAAHLSGCSHGLFMAVTLGHAAERELIRLSHTPTRAVYFDAACSLLAEAAADAAEAHWLGEIPHTASVFRYSPGYGDLPMSVQPHFLALVGADRLLGLSLTDSGLMIPRKSITAVVGIARSEK